MAAETDGIRRVRHLHRETTISGVAWACAEGECEHPQCHDGGESPEVEFRVCAHELDIADQAGLLDEWYPGWVMYPCQTIKALDFPPLAGVVTPPVNEGGQSDA